MSQNKIKKIVINYMQNKNIKHNNILLAFHFGIAATLLCFFFLIWRKIILGRLQGFQKHIEHWDLFELFSWLLAFSSLDMMFWTIHMLKIRIILLKSYQEIIMVKTMTLTMTFDAALVLKLWNLGLGLGLIEILFLLLCFHRKKIMKKYTYLWQLSGWIHRNVANVTGKFDYDWFVVVVVFDYNLCSIFIICGDLISAITNLLFVFTLRTHWPEASWKKFMFASNLLKS